MVLAPPHFKEKPPEAVFVKIGETLTVHCRAHGTPTPTVVWQKVRSHSYTLPSFSLSFQDYFLIHKVRNAMMC